MIHKILGPVGIAAKVKAAGIAVGDWAKLTPFRHVLMSARDVHGPANPWFANETKLIADLTLATLFAGVVGTTDMTLKCVKYQMGLSQLGASSAANQQALFAADPERYLVELMRYDSAVTSVTETLGADQTIILEGGELKFKGLQPYPPTSITNKMVNK